MAKELDYKTPVTVKITNTNKADAVEMTDGGSYCGPMQPAPGEKAYKNMTREVTIYHTNTVQPLAPGDSVEITCGSSREINHYLGMSVVDGLKVETVAAPAKSA